MNRAKSILWYDLETFGLNPHVDRIAQAGYIRTDLELNIIEEPSVIYNRLTDDYLPQPESCLVTGITPDVVNSRGMREYDFISKLNSEFIRENTTVCGYNNINFDDEAVRSTLYRNLMDPFERESKKGRTRWDIINLVRAARDLRPEGICFDKKNEETGFTSFRLTDLTEENGIEQVGAHDALVDVYATIAIARLIKTKQPRLYSYAYSHRTKYDIWNLIEEDRSKVFLSTMPLFASERGNTHPLMPIWRTSENSSDIYFFDLLSPVPSSLDEIADLRESGIIKIQTNRCPFLCPISVLDKNAEKRLGFTKDEMLKKASEIKRKCRYLFDLSSLIERTKPEYEEETDPDYTIYESFMDRDDKEKLKSIMSGDKDRILRMGEYHFKSEKYHKMLWRTVARNWPEVLTEKEKMQWKSFCATRLLQPSSKYSKTLDLYLRECREGLESVERSAAEKIIFKKLYDWGLEVKERIFSS